MRYYIVTMPRKKERFFGSIDSKGDFCVVSGLVSGRLNLFDSEGVRGEISLQVSYYAHTKNPPFCRLADGVERKEWDRERCAHKWMRRL